MMKNKVTKNMQPKTLIIGSIVASLIMVFAFSALYQHATSPNPAKDMDCSGSGDSISPDGRIIIGEADLICAGEAEKMNSSRSSIDTMYKSLALVSSLANIILLIMLYRELK